VRRLVPRTLDRLVAILPVVAAAVGGAAPEVDQDLGSFTHDAMLDQFACGTQVGDAGFLHDRSPEHQLARLYAQPQIKINRRPRA
jgi:hypothetical protein